MKKFQFFCWSFLMRWIFLIAAYLCCFMKLEPQKLKFCAKWKFFWKIHVEVKLMIIFYVRVQWFLFLSLVPNALGCKVAMPIKWKSVSYSQNADKFLVLRYVFFLIIFLCCPVLCYLTILIFNHYNSNHFKRWIQFEINHSR